MKRCPKCGHDEFRVIVTVRQIWNVDESGDCIDVEDDCLEVIHRPGDMDFWSCDRCNHTDRGSEFNVED